MIVPKAWKRIVPRRSVLVGGAAAVATAVVSGEVYSRTGRVRMPPLRDPTKGWGNVEDATLVFHGAGGPDAYTDALMGRFSSSNDRSYSTMVDWSEFSSNVLKASFNGQRVGRLVAEKILSEANSDGLKTLHVVGVSVGAFAADECVTRFKKEKSMSDVKVQLTLLDPFCQRGVVAPFYGERNFGKTADFAQQYLNTDDPVPSTNSVVRNCAVTDVTAVRPADIFGHDWPLVYYSRSDNVGMVAPKDQRPRGDLLRIEPE